MTENKTFEQIPVGAITLFGGSEAVPPKWLECDGSALSTTTYSKLFAIIGYSFGGAGGSFNLPDMDDRVPVGVSATKTLGSAGGADTHSHYHTHSVPGYTEYEDGTHVHTISHSHGSSLNHTHPSVTGTSASTTPTITVGNAGNANTVAGGGSQTPAQASHTHTTPSGANHSHTISGGSESGYATPTVGGSSQTYSGTETTIHYHTLSGSLVYDSTTASNIPPYQAQRYIIKVV